MAVSKGSCSGAPSAVEIHCRVSASRGRGGAKTADGSIFELDCRPLGNPPHPLFWILKFAFKPSPKCRDFLNPGQSIAHQERGYVEIGRGPFQRFFWRPARGFGWPAAMAVTSPRVASASRLPAVRQLIFGSQPLFSFGLHVSESLTTASSLRCTGGGDMAEMLKPRPTPIWGATK